MLLKIIQLILAIPQILGAVKALFDFMEDMAERDKEKKAQELKREIENAETEDDFRNAADKLSKLGNS